MADVEQIINSSPGDIVVAIMTNSAPYGLEIPLKTFSINRSIDVESLYGIGSHEKYGQLQGKIDFEGDFVVGTWWVSDSENPASWNYLLSEHLTVKSQEGLGKEFSIEIHSKGRTGARSGQLNPKLSNGNIPSGVIEKYMRCILKGDGIDIPEVGGLITKKYSFTCFRREYGDSMQDTGASNVVDIGGAAAFLPS
jgi:hypothetical protein